jgi:cobyrinic acid a,c-diamide synthase
LPRHAAIALPKRHLGLVQAEEQQQVSGLIEEAARLIAGHVDLDAVLQAASGAPIAERSPSHIAVKPPGQRIALARDGAFSFIYPHMLEAWRAAGAEISTFSPLADEGPDERADVCWLPGGYPELHAGRLAASERFRRALRNFAETRPVHGECGGYMVLGSALTDAEGTNHAMTGLLGLKTSFAQRRMHLGYRLAELATPIPGHSAGARLRGHEFHYSTILSQPDEPLAIVRDATGAAVAETGSRRGHVTGTFFHLIAEDR